MGKEVIVGHVTVDPDSIIKKHPTSRKQKTLSDPASHCYMMLDKNPRHTFASLTAMRLLSGLIFDAVKRLLSGCLLLVMWLSVRCLVYISCWCEKAGMITADGTKVHCDKN